MRARHFGSVSLALVNLTAAISLTAAPVQAEEIELENADSGEIRSHLEDLRQRRESEEERLDRLETERSDLHDVIDTAEKEFGTIEVQLEQATAALSTTKGDLSGAVEALGEFRTEQNLSHQAAEQASERLETIEPEISRSEAGVESLAGEIGTAERALEAAERKEAAARRYRVPESGTAAAPPPSSGNSVVQFAYDQLGKPYGFGKTGPGSYDCSGLVLAAYAQSGVSLSRTSQAQWNDSVSISRGDLAPGDLVFSYGTGHIAIYVGGNQVIHATKPGDVVKTASIDDLPVSGYRRVRG